MTIKLLGDFKFGTKTLIGLAGQARSGKDTSGKILSDILGYPTYSLASPIKDVCNTIFGWDERHSNGELKEVTDEFWGISPRYAYQTLGTEWGRNLICDDIWLRRADMMYKKHGSLIICDIRFQNEADFIRNNGGQIIHIFRDGAEKVLSHSSEAGIDQQPCDVLLYNNSSMKILEANLQALAAFFKTPERPTTLEFEGDAQ